MTGAVPARAMTYVVMWDDRRLVKIGRAWKTSRLRMLTGTGGRLAMVLRDTLPGLERALLAAMREKYEPAFSGPMEAYDVLPWGRGWTEVFKIDGDPADVMQTIYRGARGHVTH